MLQIPFDPVRKYLLETNIAPENGWLEVGRLISFWEGFLARAMLVSGSVFRHTKNPLQNHLQKGLKHKGVYNDTWPKNSGEIHPYFFDRFDRCQVKVIVFRWWNFNGFEWFLPPHAKNIQLNFEWFFHTWGNFAIELTWLILLMLQESGVYQLIW